MSIADVHISQGRRPQESVENLQTPKNVAPKGLPSCRNFCLSMLFTAVADAEPSSLPSLAIDVFSLKSCVMAMPIDANESDVRSHAKNVRSAVRHQYCVSKSQMQDSAYLVRGDRVPHCPCSQVRRYRTSQQAVSSSVLSPPHPRTPDRYRYCLVASLYLHVYLRLSEMYYSFFCAR